MTIERIDQPLQGERVVALSPEDAGSAATDWRRRPNLFAGRTLTEATLQGRQRWQAGHLHHRARALTAGVVRGLEVFALPGSGGARLLIEPGQGLAVDGEDVVLVRRAECLLNALPVVAPPAWLQVQESDVGEATETDGLGLVNPRGVPEGITLADLRSSAGNRLPRVGVLVLQAVTVDTAEFDPNDPCDRCPCGEGEGSESNVAAFEDWRMTDGARLLWYAWPVEWRALPLTTLRLRNALAHTVFDAEAALRHGEALPWEDWGVPLALVGLSETGLVQWVDRASVVRQGGRAKEARLQRLTGVGVGGALGANSRLPALWQARIEQFAQQMAETPEPLPAPNVLADPYLRLPPCGLMPKSALDLSTVLTQPQLSSPFFPPGFELDAVPVPIEQLDLAMREAAPLASFDMSAPERLRLLVPVTQASWEPRLLHPEVVDPAFQEALSEFTERRARELGARQGLRHEQPHLVRALTGRPQVVPELGDDPQALDEESLEPWGPPPLGGGHVSTLQAGAHAHLFDGALQAFTPTAVEALYAWVCLDPDHPPRCLMLQWRDDTGWSHRAYWGEPLLTWGRPATGAHPFKVAGHFHVGDLPPAGRWVRLEVPSSLVGLAGVAVNGMSFDLFDGRAAWGPTGAGARPWFGHVLPTGARQDGNEPWLLLSHNDLWAPFEAGDGLQPTQPVLVPPGGGHAEAAQPGIHQHYLEGATATLGAIAATENLFVWVYLDATRPPRELMIQWKVGPNWNTDGRRAYWGEDLIAWGVDKSPSRRPRGALPKLGEWVRLEVPSSELDIGTRAINGIAFTLFDGCAAFGGCGKIAQATTNPPGARAETTWFSGSAPAGASLVGTWTWLQPLEMVEPTPAARVGQASAIASLIADPVVNALSEREQAQLPLRGLEGFMAFLRARIDRADDITDFGFTHMQVDMHRIRQMMMTTSDASRLATSPVLAAIAKSDSAVNVQTQIKEFIGRIKQPSVTAPRSPEPVPVSRAVTATAFASMNVVSTVTSVQMVQQKSQITLLKAPSAPINIVYANPVVGLSRVRTVAVADRLKQPPSTEARDFALANRQRTVLEVLQLLQTFTAEDGGTTPALLKDFKVRGLTQDPFLEGVSGERALADFLGNDALKTKLLAPPPTTIPGSDGAPKPVEPDEAMLFTQTVALSENTIAILRSLEGRLAAYRSALTRCEQALGALQGHIEAAGLRVRQADDRLAEARHDVGVARALLEEEKARVQAVNARRSRVLAQEVQYLAFVRPRETSTLLAAPWRVLDPGLLEAPVPACLRDHDDVPDELDEMLKVLREAPAAHFVVAPAILQKIDRPELLLRTIQSAQLRSTVITQRVMPTFTAAAGQLGVHIGQMLVRQTQAIAVRAEAVQRLDIQRLSSQSWQTVQREAQAVISLGDIIDGDHGKGEVSRRASELFERIAGVCACLHAEFSGVLPAVRLEWAEVMSQFDEAPNLRNLGSLPRWSSIPYVDRRQMQAYTDFLFDQVPPANESAVALVNDVVRMALLLASHAPVGRIVAGRMPRPVTAVRVGSRIPLTALDNSRLRVGMQAMIYKGNALMARATVEDVGQGEVSARLVHTSSVQIDLDTDVRVHFDQAKVLSSAPVRKTSLFKV
ncbi:hypothetical protein [Hydrogenophaga sp. PBL-H3]|uniref:hypothetical protein n=1 Tax=Hydrogenophaga sp. PBL-H3 TaxID=434010 RepID=UPI0013200B10|nr:hypothetical protein [Hydrogenophaga sp. PBL-H3]QHE75795.1 hypothetical protein F9Z45_06845 [Hydrogenophaga sp. PBL-H3]QHE80220.1 hypothetical protein F9Z44_06845 [Hydrogenophaga sp. PBL-H3]